MNDLDNVKIGVLNGTVQHDYFGSDENKVKSVNPYPSTFLAVKAMAQGKVDAVAEDAGALRYIMNDQTYNQNISTMKISMQIVHTKCFLLKEVNLSCLKR